MAVQEKVQEFHNWTLTKDLKAPHALLHTLCSKIIRLKDVTLSPYYKIALTTLGSSIASAIENDEFEVAEKIKKKLVRQGRDRDAAVFSELYRKLQAQDLLKNQWAVLYLLHRLGDDSSKKKKAEVNAFTLGLGSQVTSTPFQSIAVTPFPSGGVALSNLHTTSSTATSGISSIHGSLHSAGPSTQPHSTNPNSYIHTTVVNRNVSRHENSSNQSPRSASKELPEIILLREIIYIFQGIEGTYIRLVASKDSFRIDSKIGIPRSVKTIVQKLGECGWLYDKVRKYASSRSNDRAFGLVGQSFCASLHQELTEYYRLVAVLESQLQQEGEKGACFTDGGLTLRRLNVWTCDPLVRLKGLAALVDACSGKKGGALASSIHSYIQHGDPSVRALVKHTLTLVVQPIFSTILRWIYDGELEDTYHEFFVASDPTVKDDRLWHDKYGLRKSMIPSFLTPDQANKIMLTGKSINFLRQVCHDHTTIRNRDVVKASETHQVESIFSQDLDGVFQKMIDTVYHETSTHLMEVLHVKYKFLEHLKAMRRYLLLGQGDFIRHLMDLLEEDLAKPANTLFLHNLTGILEAAVRATNAQYDDTDILKRLDVRLLEVSYGDTGWDVFSLDYHVDGPIRTVFTPDSMVMYLRVFNFLWRAKRMEYILARIWKGQMASAKTLRAIPELSPVLHQCHIIASEMVHFVQQVQYYINFEVLECSWDELLKKVQEAEDLDHIIAAHQHFLQSIITRSLLDSNSSKILTQLRAIFDLIIQFQQIQDTMYQAAADELLARQLYQEKAVSQTEKDNWGVSVEDGISEEQRQADFRQTLIPTTRGQLRVHAQSYQDMVKEFLVMLASHSDVSLRFLSFRLDFNEHYKVKEPKLQSPAARNLMNKGRRRPEQKVN